MAKILLSDVASSKSVMEYVTSPADSEEVAIATDEPVDIFSASVTSVLSSERASSLISVTEKLI